VPAHTEISNAGADVQFPDFMAIIFLWPDQPTPERSERQFSLFLI